MEYTFVQPERIDEEGFIISYKTHAFVKAENGRNYQLCNRNRFIASPDEKPEFFDQLENDGSKDLKDLCKKCEKILANSCC